MVRTRFGLLDTIESIPLETKKRLKKKCNNNDEQGGNDKRYVETTYSELKSLRDEGKLVPGALYRITDYQCTTAQEGTRSAGHQFDIIVTALTESVLSEDAKAIQHRFEIPQKCYSFYKSEELFYKGTVIIEGIEYWKYENEDGTFIGYSHSSDFDNNMDDYIPEDEYPYIYTTAYIRDGKDAPLSQEGTLIGFTQDLREFSYFSNSNLAAWKLKYCLDNDENRFAWAKNLYLSPVSHRKCIQGYADGDNCTYIFVRQPQLDNENGLAWALDNAVEENISIKNYVNNGREDIDTQSIGYTQSEDIYIGQSVSPNTFEQSITVVDFSEQGKGVIYQMIDEYGNNCPYDFKNIQFLRSKSWHNEHTDWAEEVIGEDPDRDIYYFTFSYINNDFSVEDVSVVGKVDDVDVLMHAENNIINVYSYSGIKDLNNIILVSSYYTDGGYYYGTISNVFGYNCRKCTFGDQVNHNVFDIDFANNIMSNFIFKNKSFYSVYGISQIGHIQYKIIYMDSYNTICFKDINDAFSET